MKNHKYHKEKKAPAVKSLRRCLAPGCAELIPPPQRFCTPHLFLAPSAESARSKYHRETGWFYSSAVWRKFRLRFLRRNPICVKCAALATQVDHIVPIAQGGAKLMESNCQSLCASCHSKKTIAEQADRSGPSELGRGGANLSTQNRHLPSVQLKKSVRRFWAKGVSDSAISAEGVPDGGQNRPKRTDMMDGDVRGGGEGGVSR